MKRSGIIMGMLLMLLIAGNGSLFAQRGMRGMMDTTRMNRMRMGMDLRQRYGIGPKSDSLIMRGMRQGAEAMHMRGVMWHAPMYGIRRGMDFGPGYGMRRGMGQMLVDSVVRRQMGPAARIMESIPNVTEKQKKEIADLIVKQQNEMKKFREEITAKMQSMRETHRKNVLNLLTDEQKKFLDANSGNTNAGSSKNK